MEQPALLSVIIPARNAADTLAHTLDSLARQSSGEWEAIIVDDRSTDETATIARGYCGRDHRFHYVQGEGTGVSAARNKGISAACGGRLLFLDADDWIADDYVERMGAGAASAAGADVLFCGFQRVTPRGELTPMQWPGGLEQAPFGLFARQNVVAINSVTVCRRLVAQVGGFDTRLRTCEDWDLWQRIARTGARFRGVPEPLAFYRMSPGSLTDDVQGLIRDARIVIGRGFAVDEGVDAALGGSADFHLALYILWCAAREAGRGRDADDLLAMLRPGLGIDQHVEWLATTLLDGLMVGSGSCLGELATAWAGFRAPLARTFDRLGAISDDRDIGPRLSRIMEERAITACNLPDAVHLNLYVGARIDILAPKTIVPPQGADQLYAYICAGRDVLAVASMAVFGPIDTAQLVALAIDTIGPAEFRRRLRQARRGGYWLAAGRNLLAATMHNPLHAIRSPRAFVHSALDDAVRNSAGCRSGKALQAELIAEAERHALADLENIEPLTAPPRKADKPGGDPAGRRAGYWEAFFQQEDPWNYGSDYERGKYARTLSLLPVEPIGQALELACAEGMFTEELALRVERLLATDISHTAIGRAARRCREATNVTFRQLDFMSDPLPQEMDLIVCSEVLYYVGDEADLHEVCRRMAQALKPGGHILTAHAFVLKDDLSRTAFDWDSPFGAQVIAESFSATPGLALERSICTDLYRIDRYCRLPAGKAAPEPAIEIVDLACELEPDVARNIVWEGATIRRLDAWQAEHTRNLPILMYHRIADDGPVALARYRIAVDTFRKQMRWLRSHGYYAVTSPDIDDHFRTGRPFCGRPVLISFDDGFRDFADAAWPILRECDLSAEIFVATDKVGKTADWDAGAGAPAQLMDWRTIRELDQAGARFGSHLATHRHPFGLSSRELLAEMARSRATLRAYLGHDIGSVAAPFGECDERFVRIAAECGYSTGYTTREGIAAIGDHPLKLPRIEVCGDWSIDDFATAMRSAA